VNNRLAVALVILIGAIVIPSLSVFSVDQRQNAIVFEFGKIKEVISEPGLHLKWPFIQNVRFFDNRILTLDAADAENFITSEKNNVLVDFFVKWRINDLRQYYQRTGGDEALATVQLQQTVKSTLQDEFTKRTVHDVVSGEREKIMEIVKDRAGRDINNYGIEIVDVRVKRVELPDGVRDSVYGRMRAERASVASQARSQGSSEAEKIRAQADRDREVIIAEAYRNAQRVMGEGDAKASATYARAYSENPEFYAFYRSLDAYRNSFKGKNDVLVIEPSSEFFKYFRNSGRGGK